ncbi:hypothetical protein JCM3775_002359 [Rhodotorula graminis]
MNQPKLRIQDVDRLPMHPDDHQWEMYFAGRLGAWAKAPTAVAYIRTEPDTVEVRKLDHNYAADRSRWQHDLVHIDDQTPSLPHSVAIQHVSFNMSPSAWAKIDNWVSLIPLEHVMAAFDELHASTPIANEDDIAAYEFEAFAHLLLDLGLVSTSPLPGGRASRTQYELNALVEWLDKTSFLALDLWRWTYRHVYLNARAMARRAGVAWSEQLRTASLDEVGGPAWVHYVQALAIVEAQHGGHRLGGVRLDSRRDFFSPAHVTHGAVLVDLFVALHPANKLLLEDANRLLVDGSRRTPMHAWGRQQRGPSDFLEPFVRAWLEDPTATIFARVDWQNVATNFIHPALYVENRRDWRKRIFGINERVHLGPVNLDGPSLVWEVNPSTMAKIDNWMSTIPLYHVLRAFDQVWPYQLNANVGSPLITALGNPIDTALVDILLELGGGHLPDMHANGAEYAVSVTLLLAWLEQYASTAVHLWRAAYRHVYSNARYLNENMHSPTSWHTQLVDLHLAADSAPWVNYLNSLRNPSGEQESADFGRGGEFFRQHDDLPTLLHAPLFTDFLVALHPTLSRRLSSSRSTTSSSLAKYEPVRRQPGSSATRVIQRFSQT